MWRVLIVGADGGTAAALREGLKEQGYGVVSARSAAIGARLVRDVDLAIVAMDGTTSSSVDATVAALGTRVPVMVVPDMPTATLSRAQKALDRVAFGDVTVDFQSYRAEKGGRHLALSSREVELLRYLAERSDRVVSRDELLQAVWDTRGSTHTRTVDMHVAKLRRKLGPAPDGRPIVLTIHGAGYRFAG